MTKAELLDEVKALKDRLSLCEERKKQLEANLRTADGNLSCYASSQKSLKQALKEKEDRYTALAKKLVASQDSQEKLAEEVEELKRTCESYERRSEIHRERFQCMRDEVANLSRILIEGLQIKPVG